MDVHVQAQVNLAHDVCGHEQSPPRFARRVRKLIGQPSVCNAPSGLGEDNVFHAVH